MHHYDLSNAAWFKSSYSDGHGGNCIEVAAGVDHVVPVRDSKVPDGDVLLIAPAAWAAFVVGVRRG
ncbi:DUF397 domain-containing protein [Streptomyces sp. NPDC048604]|uniref:DUF397 domain-containing protein n=1 Tax=Streptomyces sp. NPDC048604 TaxID=3365578 RepID=UPI00372055FB